jgi:queuine tRNA-ribosyltransferase
MPSSFRFHRDHTDAHSRARAGRWVTPHVVVETPALMPVETRGSVEGVWPEQLREIGAQMILAGCP